MHMPGNELLLVYRGSGCPIHFRSMWNRPSKMCANDREHANNRVQERFFSAFEATNRDCRGVASRDYSEQGTIVIHSVDDDMLHPYTGNCMRLDLTSIISIHHSQNHSQRYGLGSCLDDGVVIARTSFIKLRRCGMPISASELRAEIENSMSKGPEAIETAIELLDLLQNSPSEGTTSRDSSK